MYTKTEREGGNILRQLLPPDKQVKISSSFKCTIRDCGKANAAAAASASQKSSAAAGSDRSQMSCLWHCSGQISCSLFSNARVITAIRLPLT